MKQTIYVDVLLAVNLYINYFLLLSVGKFLRLPLKRWRLVMGAVLGAAYSLVILLPEINPWLFLAMKLGMSVTILFVSFPVCGVKTFLRETACFYLISFAFAGMMLAIWYFLSPNGMLVKNSVVYFDLSPMVLLIATVVSYTGIKWLSRVMGRTGEIRRPFVAEICYGGEKAELRVKVDTGNSLKEPFSGSPVIVAYRKAMETVWKRAKADRKKLRIIPYHAVGGEGLLEAFCPEEVVLRSENSKIEISGVYIAVSERKLSETFDALIGPELLAQGRELEIRGKR